VNCSQVQEFKEKMFSKSELLLVSSEGSSTLQAVAEGCKKYVNMEKTLR